MLEKVFTGWDPMVLAEWQSDLLFGFLFMLALLTSVFAGSIITKLRSQSRSTIEQHDILDEEKNCLDSSFSAYLGHNALTESSPFNPNYTSHHAITRLRGQSLYDYLNTVLSDEPPSYETHDQDDPSAGHWQMFAYTDSPAQQMCFDTTQNMQDDQDMRTWQRKTRQIYGV